MAYQQIDPKDLGPHLAKRSEELHYIVHAHWIMPRNDDGMSDPVDYQVRCSKCGFGLDPQTWVQELQQYGADKYCPKCGAQMDNSIKINYHVNFKNCGTKMNEETKDA